VLVVELSDFSVLKVNILGLLVRGSRFIVESTVKSVFRLAFKDFIIGYFL
jgi:hypothetical protein